MDDSEVAKALGQIAPRNTGSVAVEHSIDEQTVVARWPSDMTSPARQQVFDQFPLGVRKGMSTCNAPYNVAPSSFDDTP